MTPSQWLRIADTTNLNPTMPAFYAGIGGRDSRHFVRHYRRCSTWPYDYARSVDGQVTKVAVFHPTMHHHFMMFSRLSTLTDKPHIRTAYL